MVILSIIARCWRWRSITPSTQERVGPTGQKPKGKWSGRSAISFLARTFRNLDDLNGQLDDWLATVANVRVHGTTQKVVAEAFAAERDELQALPAMPFDALLKLERRVSHDGLVSIGGSYYSVPDRTRRIVEVQQLPDVIRILDGDRIVAIHPVLEGRRRTHVAPEHRRGTGRLKSRIGPDDVILSRTGDHIPRRSLAFYQAVGNRLATSEGRS
jgi:hypothetical protein